MIFWLEALGLSIAILALLLGAALIIITIIWAIDDYWFAP